MDVDIYITDLNTGNLLRLPMVPEKISVSDGAAFQSYDIMSVGGVKFPYGENLTNISWSGMLMGEAHKNAPYIREWLDPKEVQSLFRKGDKVKIAAGNLLGYFYVLGVSHNASSRTMNMELERV